MERPDENLTRNFLNLTCFRLQVVEDGYEFFAKRQLVTLFSAPNYCGEFDNAGAMMSVDETLMCSFQVRCCLYTFRAVSHDVRLSGWRLYIFRSCSYFDHRLIC